MRGLLAVCGGGAVALCCGRPAALDPVGGAGRFQLPPGASEVRAEAAYGSPDFTRLRFEVATVEEAVGFAVGVGCTPMPIEAGELFEADPCVPEWWSPGASPALGCRAVGRTERVVQVEPGADAVTVWFRGYGW